MTPEEQLTARGLVIPPPPPPVANYVRAVRYGNLLYLSGHGPNVAGGKVWKGKLGRDLSVEEGYACAQAVALNLLSSMKQTLGELSKVKRIIKVLGMVNAIPEFEDQPKVINGASDLFVDLWGEPGRHARSAVGMGSLPMGIPVEIEVIVEVE
ncbi:MAG: RidA family protein [Chloroflexi bacterium]|nr:RidA family protein [Chloroflexota bacterium]